MILYALIVTVQMILSMILGCVHGGVFGYFVAGINMVGILLEAVGLGWAIHDDSIGDKKKKQGEETT